MVAIFPALKKSAHFEKQSLTPNPVFQRFLLCKQEVNSKQWRKLMGSPPRSVLVRGGKFRGGT